MMEEEKEDGERVFFRIGELAERADLSKRSLRYYEELGLLSPSDCTEGGFRLYKREDLHRVRVIKSFKTLGFSLEEIGRILESEKNFSQEEGEELDKEKELEFSTSVLEKQLSLLEGRIEQLEEKKGEVKGALETLKRCRECSQESCPPQCSNREAFL